MAIAVLLTVAGCGGDDSDDETSPTTTGAQVTTTAAPGTTAPGGTGAPSTSATLKASLTGQAEVPGPGDNAGSGSATVTLDSAKGEVCAQITVSGIARADKAHIHSGVAGQAGPVVVTLQPPSGGSSQGCVSADGALVGRIIADPGGFYVNVHNPAYPNGAVRGQLTK